MLASMHSMGLISSRYSIVFHLPSYYLDRQRIIWIFVVGRWVVHLSPWCRPLAPCYEDSSESTTLIQLWNNVRSGNTQFLPSHLVTYQFQPHIVLSGAQISIWLWIQSSSWRWTGRIGNLEDGSDSSWTMVRTTYSCTIVDVSVRVLVGDNWKMMLLVASRGKERVIGSNHYNREWSHSISFSSLPIVILGKCYCSWTFSPLLQLQLQR